MTIRKITAISAACLFALLLSGCGGQKNAENENAESSTLSVVEESSEVTAAEQIDESSESDKSSGETSVYDSTYTVDQYGTVYDALGFEVSRIDPNTYEGSITYIGDESSDDEDSEELGYDDYSYEIVDDEVDGNNIVKIISYNGSDENVRIPEEIDGRPVTIIGDSAFKENTNIKSVFIPDTVKAIQTSAFYRCDNLSMISFGEKSQLRTIYTDAFAGTAITEITIPKSCKTISDQVFSMCHELRSLTLLGMETNVSIDLWLPKECVVYGYKDSIAHKKLFSLYGFTFKVIDE